MYRFAEIARPATSLIVERQAAGLLDFGYPLPAFPMATAAAVMFDAAENRSPVAEDRAEHDEMRRD